MDYGMEIFFRATRKDAISRHGYTMVLCLEPLASLCKINHSLFPQNRKEE